MSQAALTLQVTGLAKTKLTKLRQLAKQSGLTAEKFAKQLIEDGLSIRQRARSTPFDELLAPLRSEFKKSGATEAELDGIVDAARTRHHQRTTRKRRWLAHSKFRVVLDTNTLLRGLASEASAANRVLRTAERRLIIPPLSKLILPEMGHLVFEVRK